MGKRGACEARGRGRGRAGRASVPEVSAAPAIAENEAGHGALAAQVLKVEEKEEAVVWGNIGSTADAPSTASSPPMGILDMLKLKRKNQASEASPEVQDEASDSKRQQGEELPALAEDVTDERAQSEEEDEDPEDEDGEEEDRDEDMESAADAAEAEVGGEMPGNQDKKPGKGWMAGLISADDDDDDDEEEAETDDQSGRMKLFRRVEATKTAAAAVAQNIVAQCLFCTMSSRDWLLEACVCICVCMCEHCFQI
jgi:hypothetical protein